MTEIEPAAAESAALLIERCRSEEWRIRALQAEAELAEVVEERDILARDPERARSYAAYRENRWEKKELQERAEKLEVLLSRMTRMALDAKARADRAEAARDDLDLRWMEQWSEVCRECDVLEDKLDRVRKLMVGHATLVGADGKDYAVVYPDELYGVVGETEA